MPRRTNEARWLNLCIMCKKGQAAPNRASCPACLEKSRTRNREAKRKLFIERMAAGRCVKCGSPHAGPPIHCPACLEKRRSETKRIVAARLCLGCRVAPVSDTKYCRPCLDKYSERHFAFARALKHETLSRYSGGEPKCECCGESHEAFLTVDHIDGGGCKHRAAETRGKAGEAFYRWLKKRGYPDGYRVLCFNCNFATYKLGRCPHQHNRPARE